MKRRKVLLQPPAMRDLDAVFQWAATRAPDTANAWLKRFEQAIASLDLFAERCSVAPESAKLGRELRELRFGQRSGAFRVVFVLDETTVQVLRIRRATQRRLRRSDFNEPG